MHKLFDNPHYRRQLREMGLQESTAFGCAVAFLYQLHPDAAALVETEAAAIFDTKRHFTIGVHIRSGDKAFQHNHGTEEGLSTAEAAAKVLEPYGSVLECVETVRSTLAAPGKTVLLYVLSDSVDIRLAIRERYGQDNVLTTTHVPVEHVVAGNNGGVEATLTGKYLVAAEWWLFGATDYQVVYRGGFARISSLSYNTWNNLYVLGANPSYPYNATASLQDAGVLADNLGKCRPVPYGTVARMMPGI